MAMQEFVIIYLDCTTLVITGRFIFVIAVCREGTPEGSHGLIIGQGITALTLLQGFVRAKFCLLSYALLTLLL